MAQWIDPRTGLVILQSGLENILAHDYATMYAAAGADTKVYPTPTFAGGVKNAMTDPSNYMTLLTLSAPILGPAMDNLLSEEDESGEGTTVGGWVRSAGTGTLSNSADYAWHGARSFKFVCSADGAVYIEDNVTALTAAGTQYTCSGYFKGVAGKSYKIDLYDDISGYIAGTLVTATGAWQRATVTGTFDAGSSSRWVSLKATDALNTNTFYWDGIQLETGAIANYFALDSRTAVRMSIPTPIYPGQRFSMLFYLNGRWAGDDGANHYLFSVYGTDTTHNRIYVLKDSSNYLNLVTYSASGAVKGKNGAVTSATWPANTAVCVLVMLDEANNQYLYLGRTELTGTSGSGVRETVLAGTASVGNAGGGSQLDAGLLMAYWPGNLLTPADRTAVWDTLGV